MELMKKTRPSRQARGRAHQSKKIVTLYGALGIPDVAAATALTLFAMLALPRIIWLMVAPMKGWM